MGMVRTRDVGGDLDAEATRIAAVLRERGELERQELARAVGARGWGPGRFAAALEEAVADGAAQWVGRSRYAPGTNAPVA